MGCTADSPDCGLNEIGGMSGLALAALREANRARLPQFKNKHGQPAHSKPDGSDWSPAQWLQACLGELGEYANVRKKFERGDLSFDEYRVQAAKELADVQAYLDLLAMRCLDMPGAPHPDGVDLGQATIDKFNEVSDRVDSNVRLAGRGWYRVDDKTPINGMPGKGAPTGDDA